jgi:hypothetical protein
MHIIAAKSPNTPLNRYILSSAFNAPQLRSV